MEKGHGGKKKASIATSSGEDKLVVRGRGRIEGRKRRTFFLHSDKRRMGWSFLLDEAYQFRAERGRKFAKDVRHPSTKNVHAFNSWKSVEETEEIYKGWMKERFGTSWTERRRRKFARSLIRFVDNLIESNTGFGK